MMPLMCYALLLFQVVCRQLHFSGGISIGGAFFGDGSSAVLQNSIVCSGSEKTLQECAWASGTTCSEHIEDVSVQCNYSKYSTAMKGCDTSKGMNAQNCM